MFICNCHGIRQRDIESACAAGCRTAGEVFAHTVAAPPCCGKCVREIRDHVRRRQASLANAAE
ncbi:MAG: (2Fe-2S)-binding protein [Rhodospirillales bacterium]|nr:(2Fe-2S)-binding protein [Rhodospirillales bacterium]